MPSSDTLCLLPSVIKTQQPEGSDTNGRNQCAMCVRGGSNKARRSSCTGNYRGPGTTGALAETAKGNDKESRAMIRLCGCDEGREEDDERTELIAEARWKTAFFFRWYKNVQYIMNLLKYNGNLRSWSASDGVETVLKTRESGVSRQNIGSDRSGMHDSALTDRRCSSSVL